MCFLLFTVVAHITLGFHKPTQETFRLLLVFVHNTILEHINSQHIDITFIMNVGR